MGQIGLGGGATSLGMYASGFEKPEGYYWGGDRGLILGGFTAPATIRGDINYFGISTLSDGSDFGDLSVARFASAGASNGTRGLCAGGTQDPPYSNVIDYTTIGTLGNSTDFGDLVNSYNYQNTGVAGNSSGGASNANRGLFAGGYNPLQNVIQYVDITSAANAQDFGDMIYKRRNLGSVSNGSRAVWAGGLSTPTPYIDSMDYTTIATLGNSTDFGDLMSANYDLTGCSSKTRGVFSGGLTGSAPWYGALQSITIATTANATSIGNQTSSKQGEAAAASNGVYGTWSGGLPSAGQNTDDMTYIEIDNHTSGNVTNFGDLTSIRLRMPGTSGD